MNNFLIERTHFIWLVMRNTSCTSEQPTQYSFRHVRMFLIFPIIFWTIYIYKLYRQIVDIPMSMILAPLVADLICFCYERNTMLSFSANIGSDFIEELNT